MITDEQNRGNLGSAARLTANSLGLDLTNAAGWSYDARAQYVHQLAVTISEYPSEFQPTTLQMAGQIAQYDLPALVDVPTSAPSDDAFWAQFWDEFGNNVLAAGGDVAALGTGTLALIHGTGNALGGIGSGIQGVGDISSWLLPLGAIAIVVMFAQSSAKKVSRAGWLK